MIDIKILTAFILVFKNPLISYCRLSGTLVMCLADFYLNDSVFFAYCNDRMNPDDLTLDQSGISPYIHVPGFDVTQVLN